MRTTGDGRRQRARRVSGCTVFLLALAGPAQAQSFPCHTAPPSSSLRKLDNVLCTAFDAVRDATPDVLQFLATGYAVDPGPSPSAATAGVTIDATTDDCSAFFGVSECVAVPKAHGDGCPLVPGFIVSGTARINELDVLTGSSAVNSMSASPRGEDDLNISTNNTAVLGAGGPVFLGANAQILHTTGIDGRAIVVGIVDSGIDWEHDDFLDPATGNTRVKFLWDQTDAGGPAPGGAFGFGTEWDANDIDTNVARATDDTGHGTRVAGVAAGNGSTFDPPKYEGMAPRADLVIVKRTGTMHQVLAAVRYIFDRAGSAPAVVNLSFGFHQGPHDGTSDVEAGLAGLARPAADPADAARQIDRLVVKSAGNEAGFAVHAEGKSTQTLEFNVRNNKKVVFLEVWHDPKDSYKVAIARPGGQALFPGTLDADEGFGVNDANGIAAGMNATRAYRRAKATGIGIGLLPPNGGAEVETGNWTVTLTRDANGGTGQWDAWTGASPTPRGGAVFTTGGSAKPTHRRKVSEPGNACNVITAAAHVTRDPDGGGREGLGQLSETSSPGPTRDDRPKPELSAPGRRIAVPQSGDIPNAPSYVFASGTSYSAPHVTGCIALILQQEQQRPQPRVFGAAGMLAQLLALIRTDAESVREQVDNNKDGRFTVDGDCGDDPCVRQAGHWNQDFGWGKLNCALKADDVIGAGGAFFSVDRGAIGIAGDLTIDNHPAHVYVGDRDTNGLGILKNTLGLGANDDPDTGEIDNLDAFTFQIDPRELVPAPRFSGDEFSVAFGSRGLPGTAVNAHPAHRQGHVWLAGWPFGFFGRLFGVNADLFHELELGLSFGDELDATDLENPLLPVFKGRQGITVFPADLAFPLHAPLGACINPLGCCDDFNGDNRDECDGDPNRPCLTDDDCGGIGLTMYFSLDPDSPTLAAIGARPADILYTNGDGEEPGIAFAANDLTLIGGPPGCAPPVCDDVDGFFLDQFRNPIFSLRDGSPSLGFALASAADFLEPGLIVPHVYLRAAQLGLDRATDDVDALDVELCRYTARRQFYVRHDSAIESGAYLEVSEPAGKLHLGCRVTAEDATRLVADRVRIGRDSNVFDVDANSVRLHPGAVVRGITKPAPPLPMSLDLSGRTPESCDGPEVRVAAASTSTLASGLYGDLVVGPGATLTLGPGPYGFCSIRVEQDAMLQFTGDLPATLSVAGELRLGRGIEVEPDPGTPLPTFEVGGRRAVLGDAEFSAHLRAPGATVRVGQGGVVEGSILADVIRFDRSSRLGCGP